MMLRRVNIGAVLFICIAYLAGCSDSGETPVSAADIASVNLGADIQVQEGQSFTLTAAVYPEGGNVTWTQLSGPSVDNLPTAAADSTTLQTPTVNTDTTLVFEATYTAEDGQVVTDQIQVMISDVNLPPIAVIELQEETLPPFNTYEIVTLSAQSSSDPDGEIRVYQWQQVDSNAPLKFTTDLTSEVLEFEAPLVSEITNYKIQLTVTDNFNLSQTNVIDVAIASSTSNLAANAGEDQTVDEFTKVTLDASQSVSVISTVSCGWQQTVGTAVTLTDSSACVTEFVAPDVDSTTMLTFVLAVMDNANNQATDSVNVNVMPLNLGTLHDTGVTECYDNASVITCDNDEFPSQDAEVGRDAVSHLIDKSGSGDKAFDFTKFDVNGDEISNDALVFSCVRDNYTGLIWEVKAPTAVPEFSSLRGVENYYSMEEGQAGLSSCPDESSCDVETYITAVNTETFCGGANWRLPTYSELLALMDYGDLDKDNLLDNEFFPYTPNSAKLGHKFYWVSDKSAEGGAERFNWVLDLQNGDDAAILLTSPAYVILVRTP